jgi:hypothetical protein
MNLGNRRLVGNLFGLLVGLALAAAGCGGGGVEELTQDLNNTGYNHCLVIPGPNLQLPWQETGFCLEANNIAVCEQVASKDCVRGRNVKTAPYNTCLKHEDTNACK